MSISAEKRIGQNMIRKRSALGWTQDEAAKVCGMSVRSYGKIERGAGNPTLRSLERISEALEMDIADLFRCD